MDKEIEKRNEIISINDNLLKIKIKNIGPSIIHFSNNKLNKLNKKFIDNQNLFEWLNVIKFTAAEFGCLDLIYYHYNSVQSEEENKKMNKFLREIILETTDISLYSCYIRYYSIKRILEELIQFFDLNNLELINYDQDISRQGFYNKSIFEINFDHLDLFQTAFQIYKTENYCNQHHNLNETTNQLIIYDKNNNLISRQQINSNLNQIEIEQKEFNYLNIINESNLKSKITKESDQYNYQLSNLSQLCSSPKLASNSFININNCFNEIISELPIKSLVCSPENIQQSIRYDSQLSSSPLSIYSQPITSISPDQICVKPDFVLNKKYDQFNSSSISNPSSSPRKICPINSLNNRRSSFPKSSDTIFKKPQSISIPIRPVSLITNKKLKNLIKNRIGET